MFWFRSIPLADIAPTLLLAGFSLFWFSDTIADPDLWGHVRFGQDILRTGTIIQADVYSYRTLGHPWINHEWLSEIVFAWIHARWGSVGLISLKLLISLMIIGLCRTHLRREGLGPYSSVLLLLLVSIPFRLGLGTIRPQIFTYIFFLVLLLLIKKADFATTARLWGLPILFVPWVNLHGGVLAGIGVLGLWLGVRCIDLLRRRTISTRQRIGWFVHYIFLGVACGLVLFLNPHGVELVVFLLRTATVPRPEISEWTALALMSLPGQLFLLLLTIGIIGLIFGSDRLNADGALIFSVTTVMTVISSRHYPLFALSLIVMGGGPIAAAWNRWRPARLARLNQNRVGSLFIIMVAMVLLGLCRSQFQCIRIEPFYFTFPARAVAWLDQCRFRGNIAVPFDWGEYVIWHLGPEAKVSNDGRRETVYPDENYRQSMDFERGTGIWDALLKASQTDLILARNGSPTANLLSLTKGWLPLYQDRFSVMFAHTDDPGIARMLETPIPTVPDNGAGLCFPEANREIDEPRHEAGLPPRSALHFSH